MSETSVKKQVKPVVKQAVTENSQNQITMLNDLLNKQRAAHLENPYPSYSERVDRLNRLIAMMIKEQEKIVEALSEDFSTRSPVQSLITDVVSVVESLKYAKSSLKKWMKPDKRKTAFPFNMMGGKSSVMFEPMGVVGNISPWNFPFYLTFAPLAGIISAGNRVMIKPSEYTEHSGKLMKELVESEFNAEEMAVVLGGPDLATNFSALAFDQLLYTGGTSIAKHIMRASAENLTKLTLELGGKCPVIIGKDTDLEQAAMRVMFGKTLNAGQICLAPDYVLITEDKRDAFVNLCQKAVAKMYENLQDHSEYTAIVNKRHYSRIQNLLKELQKSKASVVECNPANEKFSEKMQKIPPTLVIDPDPTSAIMNEEIFGPLLLVRTVKDVDEAIKIVNDHNKALALYYFGDDKVERAKVLHSTSSGAVTFNDVMSHIQQADLPFGGVGASGQGKYQGYDGFKEFSHQKAVYKQIRNDGLLNIFRPPYTDSNIKMINSRLKH